jgi:hypothetical protein
MCKGSSRTIERARAEPFDSAEGAPSRAPRYRDEPQQLDNSVVVSGRPRGSKAALRTHLMKRRSAPSTQTPRRFATWQVCFSRKGASPGRARSWSEPARSMKRPSAPCISLCSLPRLSLTGEWHPTKEAVKTQAFGGLGDYENPAKARAATENNLGASSVIRDGALHSAPVR